MFQEQLQTQPIHKTQARSRNIIILILLSAPSFIYLLITYVLPPPLSVRPEPSPLDPSWQIILTDAFLRGAQFGRDLVYTYGPWGFLESPRGDPRIYPWLFSGRLLIALAFVAGMSRIAVRGIRRPAEQFAFFIWTMLLADPISVLPVVLFAVVLYSERTRKRTTIPVVHLLAVACGLTMLIKFNEFVIVGALAAALAAEDLIGRRLPIISLEIFTSAIAFWLMAGQSLFNVPIFLRSMSSVVISYSAEMFSPGPPWIIILTAVLLLAIAILTAAVIARHGSRRLWPSIAWLTLLFSSQLKEAFVRNDTYHVWMGIINALLPCTLILICRAGFFNSRRPQLPNTRVITEVCVASVVLLSLILAAVHVPTSAAAERVQILMQNLNALKRLAAGRSMSADYRRQLEEFRRVAPLPALRGTADFFPDNELILYGNSLQVHLPPIPQAFVAYNSYLSGRNASFFRGPDRPDFVFFDVAPIDNRYPSSSDTLAWRALMECYEPAGSSGHYLVLRGSGCEDAPQQIIAEMRAHTEEAIRVPVRDGFAIWAQIDIRLTRMGSIIAMLARPPNTTLTVDTGIGRRTYRISPEAARTGFLLSPLMLDPACFGRLLAKGGTGGPNRVRLMTINHSSMGDRFYEPAFDVRFYAVRPPLRRNLLQ